QSTVAARVIARHIHTLATRIDHRVPGGHATAAAAWTLVVDGYRVDHQRGAGDRRPVGAAAEGAREPAAHGQVVDDEERVVDRVGPGGGVHLVRGDGEDAVAIQREPDLLGRCRTVDLDRVVVETGLAAGAGTLAAADAGTLVARPARVHTAVQRGKHRTAAVD